MGWKFRQLQSSFCILFQQTSQEVVERRIPTPNAVDCFCTLAGRRNDNRTHTSQRRRSRFTCFSFDPITV